MRKLFLPLFLFVLFSGCASMTRHWTPYPGYAPMPSSEKVEVLHSNPDRKFQTLGSVSASTFYGSEASALKKAVGIAKEKGADAIVTTGHGLRGLWVVFWYNVEGYAIKYQED